MLQGMIDKPALGLFVVGTDTGVGKTRVAAAIARELAAAGKRVGVYKPAASGCGRRGGALVSDDAEQLWEAAGRPLALDAVCPQRFEAPLAPHLAARAEGREIDAALLRTGLAAWKHDCEIVLVEGAGGLMSPLGDDEYVADLAAELGYPLVVVAANALGVINQTLQTLIAAAVFRAGLEVAGIVLNGVRPNDGNDSSVATNRAELARRAEPPVLAELEFGATEFDRPVDWLALAKERG
jgi:dethiobiotin synthetase